MVAHAKAVLTSNVSAEEVIDSIRSGKWRQPIEAIRKEFADVLARTGETAAAKAAVRAMKEKLPGIMASGRFSSRKKPTANHLIAHSGLLCADLDGLGERLPPARSKLAASPHLWAMFISASGDGLKCVFRVPADKERHEASFRAVREHVRELCAEELDRACSDVGRLCFVSFDPDAVLNPGAIELLTVATTEIRLPTASAFCVPACLPTCVSASLHNNAAGILENIAGRSQAQADLEQTEPQLAKLYAAVIEPRFLAMAHGRNAFIKEAVPFLYRAVAVHCVRRLTLHFYDCNRALFHDSREEHIKEAEAMLRSVMQTYLASLSVGEQKVYEALPVPEQDAFRICRDFALTPEPPREPLTFFMSFDQLAMRLAVYPMQAQRILRRMEGQGLLTLVEKGKRRVPGEKAVAGTYKWLLAPPQPASATTPGVVP